MVTRPVVVPTQLVADAEPLEGICLLPDGGEDARLLVSGVNTERSGEESDSAMAAAWPCVSELALPTL